MYAYNLASFAVNFADGAFGAIDAISKAYTRTIQVLTSDRALAGYRLVFYVSRNIIEIGWLIVLAAVATIRQLIANRKQTSTPQQRWDAAIVPHAPISVEPELIVEDLPSEEVKPIDEEVIKVSTEEAAIDLSKSVAFTPKYAEMRLVQLRKACLKKGCKGAGRWNKERCLEVLTA